MTIDRIPLQSGLGSWLEYMLSTSYSTPNGVSGKGSISAVVCKHANALTVSQCSKNQDSSSNPDQ